MQIVTPLIVVSWIPARWTRRSSCSTRRPTGCRRSRSWPHTWYTTCLLPPSPRRGSCMAGGLGLPISYYSKNYYVQSTYNRYIIFSISTDKIAHLLKSAIDTNNDCDWVNINNLLRVFAIQLMRLRLLKNSKRIIIQNKSH